ncbi:appr-1-p processing enzyme family protein [Capsaspora owczarzaki ATCC 30864]|uniref:Appr-1-p processing enzyme family protein n=1 Tax=Capsaspora owczarzaki (strain ATCC 30864) TaxID=595528 RepID=A0A0D2X1G0_CAPO3|nr:appr-1-p processing enzyme family protein [Capsaspora owczarzaki ATCC 30864]KJE90744.1 appr-1-p processing enzyme family protein [Capsaspora owczarzaki ATCC 30864]|eukprot:XP_004364870.1 appr-1-p processing enzyme family protein [Capsaspora owczarzaki ATCC 30864]
MTTLIATFGIGATTVTLSLRKGDITTWSGDVVVNAANRQLSGGSGGLNGAIHKAGGETLTRACQALQADGAGVRCPTGSAVFTGGPFSSGLGAQHVIHAVGPDMNDSSIREKGHDLLQNTILSALRLAEQHGCTSIAIPAISCGNFGFDAVLAATLAIDACVNFVTNPQPATLKSIEFVLFEQAHVDCWHKALTREPSLHKLATVVASPAAATALPPPSPKRFVYRTRPSGDERSFRASSSSASSSPSSSPSPSPSLSPTRRASSANRPRSSSEFMPPEMMSRADASEVVTRPTRSPQDLAQAIRQHLTLLEASKAAAKRDLASHSTPAPEVPHYSSLQLDGSLFVLQPGTPEYEEIAKLMHNRAPIKRIKRVNNPGRAARFAAYKESLPLNLQTEHRTLHGTPSIANANVIARTGPRLDMAGEANARVHGEAFYTAEDSATPIHYATTQRDGVLRGGVCVCKVVPGNALAVLQSQGVASRTAADLLAMSPPRHSVHVTDNKWRIMFHPDAVRVDYIIDYADDPSVATLEQMQQTKHKALVAERDTKEMVRLQALQRANSALKMHELFAKACNLYQDPNSGSVVQLDKLFDIETQQHKLMLPVYEHKQEFLDQIRTAQALVVKGDVPSGKAVLVPQWLYDHLLFLTDPAASVAVLVSQRSTAEDLAKQVAKMRGCQVGQEVGMGTTEVVNIGPDTRICFMTYDFFRAISRSGNDVSKWRMVVLDEMDEHNADAAHLLQNLSNALKERQEFKVIVMGAAMSNPFVSTVQRQTRSACPILTIPDMVFPVEPEFMTEASWDPNASGALQSLCYNVLCIYNAEPGNLLVFLPTMDDVNDAAGYMQSLLAHDTNVLIKPLHAKLGDDAKRELANFDAQQPGKRLVFLATDVAETGISLPNIAIVVDTGREEDVDYDAELSFSQSKLGWISKAVHMQRRRFAGRTGPGRCYCMFTEKDFKNSMPATATPIAHRDKMDSFYLGMVFAKMNPMAAQHSTETMSRLKAAEDSLVQLGCIEKSSSGAMTITSFGSFVHRMRLPFKEARCVLMASKPPFECSRLMAIIFCMQHAAEATELFLSRPKLLRTELLDDAAKHGDHVTLWSIFAAWQRNHKSPTWCQERGLNLKTLTAADMMLKQLSAEMGQAASGLLVEPNSKEDKPLLIKKVLCEAFSSHRADARGVRVSDGYSIAGVAGHTHVPTTSCLPQDESAPLIVFQSRSRDTRNRSHFKHVTVVEASMFQPSSAASRASVSFSADDFELHVQSVANTSRVEGSVQIEVEKAILIPSYEFIIQQLQLELPGCELEFRQQPNKRHSSVVFHCLPNETETVKRRIKQAVALVTMKQKSVAVTATVLQQYFSKETHAVNEKGTSIQDAMQDKFGPHTKLHANFANSSVTMLVQGVAEQYAEDALRKLFGLPPPRATTVPSSRGSSPTASAAAAAAAAASASSPSLPAGAGAHIAHSAFSNPRLRLQQEELRVATLLSPSSTRQDIEARFGSGVEGTLIFFAHWMTHSTEMWIYGGFIRDVLYGKGAHPELDLDVGMPKGGRLGVDQAYDMVCNFAAQQRITQTRVPFDKKGEKGPAIRVVGFKSFDGNFDCSIELVNTEMFFFRKGADGKTRDDRRVDFDVNNLRVCRSPSPGQPATIALKFPDQPPDGTVEQICENIRQRRLVVLKSANEVAVRIDKMRNRDWLITF